MLTPVDDVTARLQPTRCVEAFAARPGPRFALVLSGGPTAQACYEVLAATADGIDWTVVDVYIGDERVVPPDDEDANQRLIREALLDRVGPSAPSRPCRPAARSTSAWPPTSARCRDLVTGPGIDLIHLGMGPDGHTASLFPGAPTLDAGPGELVAATEDPNGATRTRASP